MITSDGMEISTTSRAGLLMLIDAEANLIAENGYSAFVKDSSPHKRAGQTLEFAMQAVLQAAIRERVAEIKGVKPEDVLAELKEVSKAVFAPEPIVGTGIPESTDLVPDDGAVAA